MLTSYNLGGLRVFTASNRIMVYEFPPINVKAGEYVVLHFRTLSDENRNEYGDDLTLSSGTDSSLIARDLWIPGSIKMIDNTDAVYVLDKDNKVLAAVMFADNPGPVWEKDYMTEAAEFLFNQGAWKSAAGTIPTPLDVVNSTSSTATRTICRDEKAEDTRTAADWYVTVNSGNSAGYPNDPRRY